LTISGRHEVTVWIRRVHKHSLSARMLNRRDDRTMLRRNTDSMVEIAHIDGDVSLGVPSSKIT
jgi:hypothetical protein